MQRLHMLLEGQNAPCNLIITWVYVWDFFTYVASGIVESQNCGSTMLWWEYEFHMDENLTRMWSIKHVLHVISCFWQTENEQIIKHIKQPSPRQEPKPPHPRGGGLSTKLGGLLGSRPQASHPPQAAICIPNPPSSTTSLLHLLELSGTSKAATRWTSCSTGLWGGQHP